MIPMPQSLGLTLCDSIIVEEGTAKVSLVGTFTRLGFESFPSKPKDFCAFVALSGSTGDGIIELVVTDLETDEDIRSERLSVHFLDKLTEVQVIFRLEEWSFPAPGWYQFVTLIDGEWVAHRRLEVYLAEES